MALYTQLHDNHIPEETPELRTLWKNIIPNLTHNQQPYAFVENVITDEAHRGKGLATACLNYARELAISHNCYKLMLLTGSKKESTLRFYERAGYNSQDKTAFIQWI